MRNKRYYLAAALALSMAFYHPVEAYDGMGAPAYEDTELAQTDTAAEGQIAESQAAEAATQAEAVAAETAGTQAASADDPLTARTREWEKNRPAEATIEEMLKSYEGQTIVDTLFEGASDRTLATCKAAISMRTGDMFTGKGMLADRDAIYNTGYFYDIYPSFQKVPEGVILTYHVLENPTLTDVKIVGNTVESDQMLYGLLTVKKDDILNSRVLHENVQALQEQYRKDGYILMKVTDMNISPEGVLTLKINEGALEGYKVKGNEKTKDRVILREMRQKVGEPFNSKLARRSVQRVYNLGFFETVDIKMNPGVEPNAVIMEIDVTEKRTGSFGIGAGYSSDDGVIGMVSISDTNFRGTGDAVSLTYQVSGDESDAHGYVFSYRRPWLDSKETVGTLRIYDRTYEYTDYDTNGDEKESFMRKYKGGEVTFGRPVSEYSTNYITLRHREDQYVRHEDDGNVVHTNSDGTINWGAHDQAWKDKNFGITRSVTFQHVTDTRDNIYDPTMGGRVSLSAEIAGLGGDFDFQKYTFQGTHYLKVGHAQVLAFRGEYGIGNGTISEFNQYRIGGQDTLRGYREDQFRGDRMALATMEYRFPIMSKVQGALFTDWGSAWDSGFTPDDVKGSVGVGLSLNTPIGPLRLDYGRGDDGGRVHFTVGGSF